MKYGFAEFHESKVSVKSPDYYTYAGIIVSKDLGSPLCDVVSRSIIRVIMGSTIASKVEKA